MVAGPVGGRSTRRSTGALALVVVAVAAVAAGLIIQDRPIGPAAAPTAGASSGASTGAGGGASGPSTPGGPTPSTPAAGDWVGLDLGPLEVAATLRPTAADDAGVQPQTSFTLTSRTGEPARALAGRLEVTPTVELAVVDGPDAGVATIRPTGPLAPGAVYRIALRSGDGTLTGSWAFHVRGPVGVVSTIPGDATTDVPVRAGIEVTFDQEGVADMSDHFRIQPAVAGRFERHGRTQVFVPDGLAASTLYTVTITRGLARTGTDLTLEADAVFRFETAGGPPPGPRLVFGRDVIETGPGQAPLVAVRAIVPDGPDGTPGPAPTSAPVVVHRFPSLEDAARTLADFLAAPRWATSTDPLMPTTGLPVAMRFTATLEPLTGELRLIRFPAPLPEGWYVVELAGDRPAHAFLQVTPVSAWVSVLSDRTVVWVNSVATARPVAGATVAIGSGAPFATAGADGLALGPTPASLVPAAASGGKGEGRPTPSPVLRVTSGGHVLLVPFDVAGDGDAYRGEWSEKSQSADETWWTALATDRGLYRRTDRIEAWGYLRNRDDATVPSTAQVRVVPSGASRDASAPPVASVQVRPGVDGAFVASLPLAEASIGSYEVQVVVAGRVVVARWVDVTVIRKPPYQLELTANHRAVIVGTRVRWSTTATFFDGTAVAGLGLAASSDQFEDERRLTTDTGGRAAITVTARPMSPPEDWEDPESVWTDVRPQGPESADIWASNGVLVFPSALDLQATGVVANGRLRVTGRLAAVDLAKVERAIARGTWAGDAAGRAISGSTIRVRITELIPVRHQVGTDYDFIAKEVRPVYEYETDRRLVRTLTVRSGRDGRIALEAALPNPAHDYEVQLSTTDAAGRVQRRTITAGTALDVSWLTSGVLFRTPDGSPAGDATYSVGDRIAWRMVSNGTALPSGGGERYLYLVAQRGLRSAAVTDSSVFRRTFGAADAPGVFVIGVQFNGTTYAPKAAAWAMFDSGDRRITVTVGSDRARYRPGDTATLSVRTTRANGTPVAATVIVQAVDEKLYAMGGATVPSPLDDLYRKVDSGILRLTATHQVPSRSGPEGEGGDTTGGGPRSDFEDTLLVRELHTDASGRASLRVRLSDDVTSWHVTASAVSARLEAGVGERLLPVGLPFFVDVTTADSYLQTDRPTIRLRAYGDALGAADRVDFSVTSTTLGMATTTVRGTAFRAATVTLPTLLPGTQTLTVRATAPGRTDAAGARLADALTVTFDVVGSRLTATRTAAQSVEIGLPAVPSGAERSTWTFADAGRGRLLPILTEIAEPDGVRLDRALAQSLARSLLISAFGRDPAVLPPDAFVKGRYRIDVVDDEGSPTRAGVALMPYGGPDPWLAARVAVLAPGGLDGAALGRTLAAIRDQPATKRDLRIAATAGLAALGSPALGDLEEARRQPDLTPSERIWLALGFAAAGDDASAAAIERQVLNEQGERLGTWVRLRLGRTADGADATALLAVLAASLGDPLAPGLAEYAAANAAPDTDNALELVSQAVRWVERTPAAAATFAWTVDGHRTVRTLGPGELFSISLTKAQAATLAVESLSGSVVATVEARVPVAAASVPNHPALTLRRTVPASPIPLDRIVAVDLRVAFGAGAPDGCYELVELVPSGLAPLAVGEADVALDEAGIVWPESAVGQEVRFCAVNSDAGRSVHLRYLARVVAGGTFTWEPAVLELPGRPELTAITPATRVTIATR